jgi:hypothetical protein
MSAQLGRIISSYSGTDSVKNELIFDVRAETNILRLYDGGTAITTPHSNCIQHLYFGARDASQISVGLDGGTASSTGSNTEPNTLDYTIGEDAAPISNIGEIPDYIQEIILYGSDQSANRSDIETNINNYFNIF